MALLRSAAIRQQLEKQYLVRKHFKWYLFIH